MYLLYALCFCMFTFCTKVESSHAGSHEPGAEKGLFCAERMRVVSVDREGAAQTSLFITSAS